MKRFVLSDDKEGKMSSSSLQLKRWVNTSAAYSQRILERFGALHTWAKSTSMSTYHIFNYIPHLQLNVPQFPSVYWETTNTSTLKSSHCTRETSEPCGMISPDKLSWWYLLLMIVKCSTNEGICECWFITQMCIT